MTPCTLSATRHLAQGRRHFISQIRGVLAPNDLIILGTLDTENRPASLNTDQRLNLYYSSQQQII